MTPFLSQFRLSKVRGKYLTFFTTSWKLSMERPLSGGMHYGSKQSDVSASYHSPSHEHELGSHWLSKWVHEWVQRAKWLVQSEQRGASKWVSWVSEWLNRQTNGPLVSKFLAFLDHSGGTPAGWRSGVPGTISLHRLLFIFLSDCDFSGWISPTSGRLLFPLMDLTFILSLSVCLSVCLSVFLFLTVFLSLSLSLSLSFSLSLSISLLFSTWNIF